MSIDDRRARVDALFDQALELPPQARGSYLAESCAGEPDVQADVEELLRLAATDAPALKPGALAAGPLLAALTGEPTVAAGQRIGAWRVVRELGQGGMGTVFLVERADGQFEQRAALKLVRYGAGSEEILRRFERERQILASLNHAHIARLLDGGRTEDGRPFLVMEHVDGRPIDRYCDEKRLRIDERLDLFLRVGRAVQHAHRNLVVHRDVKPSNIVVTGEGEVKLLDFGIARLLAPTESRLDPPTRTVARILTPEYASPEQVRGEPVTTASDVYQLGLLLYELLTGRRAQRIDETTPSSLERGVCETPPMRPSDAVSSAADDGICAARRTTPMALSRKLRGDLDTIILYALRKEPERRYASVGELLDDVESYRRGLPVRAQRDTPGYRTRKFIARHRMGLAWGLAAALAVAWPLASLTGERLRAAREAERAAQVEKLLGDLFTLPNPRIQPRPPAARDYVDHAARLLRTELRDQPASRARLLTVLGQVYNALGLYPASVEVLQEAVAVRRARFGGESLEVAESLRRLSQSQHYMGRYEAAERSLHQAMAIQRQRLSPSDPTALQAALELGDLLHSRGRLGEAEQTLRQGVAALRASGADREALARGLQDLGNVLRDRGALAEAETRYRESIEIFRALHGEPNLAGTIAEVYLARLLIAKGELARAEGLLAANLVRLRGIYGGDHPVTGTALRDLGYVYIEQGRFAEAEARLAEAQAVFHQWLGSEHPMVPRARALQAELELRRGRPEEAASLGQATLDQFARLGLADHPAALDACRTLGEALLALGQPDRAAERLASCLAAAQRQFVPGDSRTARIGEALRRAQGIKLET